MISEKIVELYPKNTAVLFATKSSNFTVRYGRTIDYSLKYVVILHDLNTNVLFMPILINFYR